MDEEDRAAAVDAGNESLDKVNIYQIRDGRR